MKAGKKILNEKIELLELENKFLQKIGGKISSYLCHNDSKNNNNCVIEVNNLIKNYMQLIEIEPAFLFY